MTNYYAINNADTMAQDAIRRRAIQSQPYETVQQINPTNEESIMVQNQSAKSDDIVGKDDGKIGFWKGLKSFGKGILNFGAGLIGFDKNGNFSAGRLLKNVAVGAGIAAVCVLTAGTAVPAIIAGAGVAAAGAGIAKSQYQFWTAKTDAQAIAAMEDTGSNSVALGLSLVGAKATMKQVPGVDAAKYDGAIGTLKAGWDSSTIGVTKGLSAIKTGYKAYKAGGFSTLKNTAGNNWTAFKNTVVTNYKNATKTPTLEEQQANRVKQYDDKIENLQEQLQNTTDKVARRTLRKEANKYKAQKANVEKAFNEINSEKSFASAQAKLADMQAQIAKLKYESKMYEGTLKGTKADIKLAQLEDQVNVYESVISQKTTQARNIRAEIDEIQKVKVKDRTPKQQARLAELREQQKELGFKLPSRKDYEKFTKSANESAEALIKKQEAFDKAKKEYEVAEKAKNKFESGDPSEEAMLAQTKYYNAKYNLQNKYTELAQAKIENSSIQANQSAASGADYLGVVLPKVGQFFQAFNNLYGKADVSYVAGKKVPFTQFTVPSTQLGKAHTITAINKWVNPAVGGPSLDEMIIQEMQNEYIAQASQAQATSTGLTPSQVDFLKGYERARDEYQAVINAQQALQNQKAMLAQQYPQQVYSQGPTATDYQAPDYIMKANGIVA